MLHVSFLLVDDFLCGSRLLFNQFFMTLGELSMVLKYLSDM